MKRQILHSVLLAIVAMMLFALPQYAQAQNKEAYVVRSGITLTFYYDTQKATRPGTKWGIEEEHEGTFIPAWAGTDGTPNTTTTQAVFDPSFKDFRPKTTARWFNYFKALTQITGIGTVINGPPFCCRCLLKTAPPSHAANAVMTRGC